MGRPVGRRRAGEPATLWELLGLGTPEESAWMVDALCAQTDPDAFFLEHGRSNPRPAKAVCLACPVRPECLAYALERGEQFGIWGGLSPAERRSLRDQAAAPVEEVAA